MPYSFIVFLSLSGFVLSATAESSFEVMCRNQAKEIAAETYKNCITENRQTQIDQIRKEYQQKISELKSHYDGELKKVSAGQSRTANTPQTVSAAVKKDKSGVLKRASGARELPEKKMTSAKTEVIDFSKSSSAATVEVPTQKTESSDSNEIIEIPVE
jgi:hypothetical protein